MGGISNMLLIKKKVVLFVNRWKGLRYLRLRVDNGKIINIYRKW